MGQDAEDPVDLTRSIFQEPPEGLGEQEYYFGTYAIGLGAQDGIEVARAFAIAGDRLLDLARDSRESWEAARPILFCYRHALELFLKAVLADVPRTHRLADLATLLVPQLIAGRYPPDQVGWLQARIAEFDRIDPTSTLFRYHDATDAAYQRIPDPELWVDFRHLQKVISLVFQALEKIGRDTRARSMGQPASSD